MGIASEIHVNSSSPANRGVISRPFPTAVVMMSEGENSKYRFLKAVMYTAESNGAYSSIDCVPIIDRQPNLIRAMVFYRFVPVGPKRVPGFCHFSALLGELAFFRHRSSGLGLCVAPFVSDPTLRPGPQQD